MSRKSEATKRKEAALSLEEARRLFEYDPETGTLTRKVSRSNRVKAGEDSGSLNDQGYLTVSVNNKPYRVHRLAWFIYYGRWPDDQLDHINRDRSDNCISNLREVCNRENHKNLGISKRNTSGVIGVSWIAKDRRWMAYITVNYRTISLGLFITLEEAVAARKAAEVKYGFSPTHGV